METDDGETEELLRSASLGEGQALDRLLERYRARLRRLVERRLDRRVRSRVDPSDVVQDALAEAGRKLPAYLRERPIPFYPWLRGLTKERVVQVFRRHVRSSKRMVGREDGGGRSSAEGSACRAVDRLADSGTSPSLSLIREEQRRRITAALAGLPPAEGRVLSMRYVEQLPFADIAAALGVNLSAVKMRHLRALEKLRARLDDGSEAPAR